jgi:thiamine biosynthesis protein ThiS
MEIVVNGQRREVPDGITIRELLAFLGLKLERVATEVNREIIRKDRWDDFRLQAGDCIEIVHFVGGGRI